MNKDVKKVCIILFMLAFLLPRYVDAAVLGLDPNKYICYNPSNGQYVSMGSYGSCSSVTIWKTLDGQMAFCTQLNKSVRSGTVYNPAVGWNANDRLALIAGRCFDLVANTYFTTPVEQYLYATELINYIFKYPGSSDFVSNNPTLKKIYDEAVDYVDKIEKYDSKLPNLTLTVANNDTEMNKISGTANNHTYISNKITLSGLKKDYGGNDTTYTVSVSASGGGTIKKCSDAQGKTCETRNSWTLDGPSESSTTFYVKVEGGTPDTNVTINVKGANSSIYYTMVRYDDPYYAYQMLMLPASINFNRSVNKKLTLSIPPDEPTPEEKKIKHRIKASKVDEEGEPLNGAEFVIYKAQRNTHTKIADLKDNKSNGTHTLTYDSTYTYTGTYNKDDDDFFKYAYCVKETKSPNGYKVLDKPICYEPKGDKVNTCINTDTNNNVKEVDVEYCGSDYACSQSNYTYNSTSGKCEKPASSDDAEAYCEQEGYSIDGQRCIKVEEPPTVDPDTQESTCSVGQLDGDRCISVDSLLHRCPTNKTYNSTSGKCDFTEEDNPICVRDGVDLGPDGLKYCQKDGDYTSVYGDVNSLSFSMINEKTVVSISKKGITGDDEIVGAKLKICTTAPDKNGNCTIAKITEKGVKCPSYTSSLNTDAVNVSDCTYDANSDTRTVTLSWISSVVPREWKGLEVDKKYYLVEEVPPRGYYAATISTEFKINEDDSITVGSKTVSSDSHTIVVRNSLSSVTISKTDVATSQELPGAVINICETYTDKDGKIHKSVDDNGDCTLVVLADGSSATWVSTEEPHKIVGLPVGTYLLEEHIAPKGYSTAESIIFTLNSNGKLVDKDGKSLDGNKLVMHDKKIDEPKTGMLGIYIVIIIISMGIAGSLGSYYFLRKNENSVD